MEDIRYAWRGEVSLAYQVIGAGSPDIVYLQGFLSNVELTRENPALARFLRDMSTSGRLIVTDRRGLGLSERFTPTDTPPSEVLMDDVTTVLDDAGSDRPVIFATGDCGWMAMLFAATYPDRVGGLILYSARPTWKKTEDTPWGETERELLESSERTRDHFGSGEWMATANPSIRNDDREMSWAARYERLSLTPGSVYTESLRFGKSDVRSILSHIQVPTLILHRTEEAYESVENSRFLARKIRGSHLKELSGTDHFPWYGESDEVLGEVEKFLESVHWEERNYQRVLTTVLFTDIVESSAQAAEVGDAEWARTMTEHNAISRAIIARFQGRAIKSTGDGFLATFDSPARAVRAGAEMIEALEGVGLTIRSGAHTGEVELIEDDISGRAVNAASRIGDLAGPGQLLVSRTVTDLVAGGSFAFEQQQSQELKGLEGQWQLYSLLET